MLESVADLLARASVLSATTPAPVTPDEDIVTPGWIGFAVTFFVAAVTVLLIIDMVRRIRRTNYRALVREQIAAEQAVADAGASSPGASPAGGSVGSASPRDGEDPRV
ncbi:hypothetical protein [Glaciibacter flavus]|uniref:hypothetical protein n=1 Tax=Orlajensenia flava TaxID=2565934 RepID=UPI003AFF9F48